MDQKKRSKQAWERGKGAKRKGNPRYKPVNRRIKKGPLKGKTRKVYVLRKR